MQLGAAIAARPNGGVVIAHVAERDRDEPKDDPRSSRLALTTCRDLGCREPRTVELTRLPYSPHPRKGQPLSVAVAADGTPTAAYRSESGNVTIAACDDPQCRHPEVTMPVEGKVPDDFFAREDFSIDEDAGLDVVVRPDGRPAVAYREGVTGAARLISCHDRACAEITDTALTGPGRSRPGPALTHDDKGRLLVATYDQAGRRGRLVLVRCEDSDCTTSETVPLTRVRHKAGPADVVLTPDGRPQVLWADYDDFLLEGQLRVTTCASSDCR